MVQADFGHALVEHQMLYASYINSPVLLGTRLDSDKISHMELLG